MSLPVLLGACTDLTEYDEEQIRSAMQDSLLSTTESWEVRMTIIEDGLRNIQLEGDYAVTYDQEERKETKIQGNVYVQIFDSTGTMETEAWSKRANYFSEDREFELIDSVRVETAENRRLYTEFLRWSQSSNEITSDRFVTIITPTDSLTGSGFSSNTDLTHYVITDLRGRLVVD
ncbi:MAG: LPS export ABC transporter periplasmic protein LptC [Balneolaceae bacterium]